MSPSTWLRAGLVCLLSLISLPGCGLLTDAATPPADGTRPTPAMASPQTAASPSPTVSPNEPVGFPLAPNLRPSRVLDTPQGRTVAPPAENGPTAVDVARTYQTRLENDLEANRFGWNCRLHNTYEGAPAVDWYLPLGTPVLATMRGQAELYVITTVNSFDYYGVDPHVLLGLPPSSQSRYPFPGPSGGMGVFVSILNGPLRAEYGHLDLTRTLASVPSTAFIAPYGKAYGYDAAFNRPLNPDQGTVVARWQVNRGDTVGFVGNNGYSDVSHLHYQIITPDRRTKYCPTNEDFPLSGWLFGRPSGTLQP